MNQILKIQILMMPLPLSTTTLPLTLTHQNTHTHTSKFYKELASYIGGRKFLRKVSTFNNVARLVDMLGIKASELKTMSLTDVDMGEQRLKHMQEALSKQTTLLEEVAGGDSSRQEVLIENVRNYFATSTNSDAVETLSELYPFTMTALSSARMYFASHCATEREVKNLQLKLFSKQENVGIKKLKMGLKSTILTDANNLKEAKVEGKEGDKTGSGYGLWSFQGPTGTSNMFADETRLWELQCVRQHEQKIQRANQGFIDKYYLSDSGSKRARGLHVLEHRRTMVCPLCVSLVQNELNDDRKSERSNRGSEKGMLSSTFAFCQAQSDPYYKTTCHHIAVALSDIISHTILTTVNKYGSTVQEDVTTLLLRSNPSSLRAILDVLLAPDGYFTYLGGGDAKMWREAEGMDSGNTSPKLLIAADVCHKFMACDTFAPGGGGSGSSQSEVNDAGGAAEKDNQGTSELMMEEAVKLMEKWDSQNDNVDELESITKSIVGLAESTQDRMVCDDFKKVQREYHTLLDKGNSKGNQKLCFACVKMATVVVRKALIVDENDKLGTMEEVMKVAGSSICEERLWMKNTDTLKEAMDKCKGGGGKKKMLLLLQVEDNLNTLKEGPVDHASGYITKLTMPLSCPALEKYFDTEGKGSKMVTNKDIAGYVEQLTCAKEKTNDQPDKTYDQGTCTKFVAHLESKMLHRIQELAQSSSYPTDVKSLNPITFLTLLAASNGGGIDGSGVSVYDFATDVCVRPGMGCVSDTRSPATNKVYAAKQFLKTSSNSGDSTDIEKTAEGALPPGWSAEEDEEEEKAGGGDLLLLEVGDKEQKDMNEDMNEEVNAELEQEDGQVGDKVAEEAKVAKEAKGAKEAKPSITLSTDIDNNRFLMYKNLLHRIITRSGTYDESVDTSYVVLLVTITVIAVSAAATVATVTEHVHSPSLPLIFLPMTTTILSFLPPLSAIASYDRGLYMLLSVLRPIFWPDVSKDWTGRVTLAYNTSHGTDLKRRILYVCRPTSVFATPYHNFLTPLLVYLCLCVSTCVQVLLGGYFVQSISIGDVDATASHSTIERMVRGRGRL